MKKTAFFLMSMMGGVYASTQTDPHALAHGPLELLSVVSAHKLDFLTKKTHLTDAIGVCNLVYADHDPCKNPDALVVHNVVLDVAGLQGVSLDEAGYRKPSEIASEEGLTKFMRDLQVDVA